MATTATTTAPTITVRIEKLAHARGLDLPAYETAGAAGLDLKAAVPAKSPVTIAPGARALITTGLKIELPAGFEAQVRPRSGLALKHGLTVLNSPGTIDSDYRGEVGVILINLGTEPYVIRRGDRIAQMVIAPVTTAHLVKVKTLSETARGAGGFGSTKVAGSTRPKRELKKKNPPQRPGRKLKPGSRRRAGLTQSA